MTAKQLRHIAIALVAALFLWGLAEVIGGGGEEIEEWEVLPSLTAAEVDTIEFARTDDTVRLVQSAAGGWTVNGYPASESGVEEFFQATAEPVAAGLVARSASSHERMGVDSAAAARFRVVGSSGVVVNLLAGRQGRQAQSVYVRPEAEEKVYLLRGGLASLFGRTVTDWREKSIARVEPDSIARIEMEHGAVAYALERGDTGWTFADGTMPDPTRVRRLLSALGRVEAQGTAFATPAEADSADFVTPDRRLTVLGVAGDTLAALVFDSTEAGYWVRYAAGGIVYRMYGWGVDDIVPAPSRLQGQ
jgi:hypothetical protein